MNDRPESTLDAEETEVITALRHSAEAREILLLIARLDPSHRTALLSIVRSFVGDSAG